MINLSRNLFSNKNNDIEQLRKELTNRCYLMQIYGYNFNSIPNHNNEGVAFAKKGNFSPFREDLIINFLKRHNIEHKQISDYEFYIITVLTTYIIYVSLFKEKKNFYDYHTGVSKINPDEIFIKNSYNYFLESIYKICGGNLARVVNIINIVSKGVSKNKYVIDTKSLYSFVFENKFINEKDCENDKVMCNVFIFPFMVKSDVSPYIDARNKIFDYLFEAAMEKYTQRSTINPLYR